MARSKPPSRGKPFVSTRGNTESERQKSLKKEDFTAMPILRDRNKEKKLIDYCVDRLKLADEERKRRVERLRDIDVQLSGFVNRTDLDEKKRNRNNK